MAFKLAQLFVEISGQDGLLQGTFRRIRGQLGGLSSTLGAMGKLALGGAVAGLGIGLYKGVMGAIDLNETLSKTDAILGSASPKVRAFADEMASKFGLVKQETLDTASAVAGLGKGLGGLKGDALADFTIRMSKMAADLQSFANLGSMREAGKAIQIGLSGEQSDTLKQLGVTLLEDQVKARGLAMGFKLVNGELTNAAKVMARADLIMRGLADAQGDLERTADSPANAIRKVTGSITNLMNDIGAKFMPVVGAVANGLGNVIGGLGERFKANEGAFEGVATFLIGAFDTIGEGAARIGESFTAAGAALRQWIGPETTSMVTDFGELFGHYLVEEIQGVGSVVRNLPEYFELAAVGITEAVMNLGDVWDSLITNLSRIGDYVGTNWRELITDGVNAVAVTFMNLTDNLSRFNGAIIDFLSGKGFNFEWHGLLDGFQATAAELPKMLDPVYRNLDDRQKELWDQIEQRDKAARDRIAAAAAPKAEEFSWGSKAAGGAAADPFAKKAAGFSGLADFKQQLELQQVQVDQTAAVQANTDAQTKNTAAAEKLAGTIERTQTNTIRTGFAK